MKPFKFLDSNEIEYDYIRIPERTASWMWHTEFMLRDNLVGYAWQLKTVECNGIIEFLNLFPELYIIPVYSITGNNIRHDAQTEQVGWGFDIQSEHLTIEFFQLVPNS